MCNDVAPRNGRHITAPTNHNTNKARRHISFQVYMSLKNTSDYWFQQFEILHTMKVHCMKDFGVTG